MNIHFITYGDGEYKYLYAAEKLVSQAKDSNWFDSTTLFNLKLIEKLDAEWYSENIDFINSNSRGNGYWIWKPKIIQLFLDFIPEGDILVYMDGGCEINALAKARFEIYIELVNEFNMLAFMLRGQNYRIGQWTKKATFDFFKKFKLDIDSKNILNLNQIESGILFLKKDKKVTKFIKEWLKICEADNYIYLNDSIDAVNESQEFIEHRHDNAIFSLLSLQEKIGVIIENENYFIESWKVNKHPIFAPFAAFRNLTLQGRMAEMNFVNEENFKSLKILDWVTLNLNPYNFSDFSMKIKSSRLLNSKNKDIDLAPIEILEAEKNLIYVNETHRQRLILNQLLIYDKRISELINLTDAQQVHIDYIESVSKRPLEIVSAKQDMIEWQSSIIKRYQSEALSGPKLFEKDYFNNYITNTLFFLRLINFLHTIELRSLEYYRKLKSNKPYKNTIIWGLLRKLYYLIKRIYSHPKNYYNQLNIRLKNLFDKNFPIYLGVLIIYAPRNLIENLNINSKALKKYPKISIVTPSYNSGPFIEKTIQSVVSQKYPHLEYIIQDSDSQDSTNKILQRISDPTIQVTSLKDGGQTDALNQGFSKSSGEIMGWINADDFYVPGAFQYIATYFEKNSDVDVIYGNRIIVDSSGAQIGHWILPKHEDEILKWVDFVPQETMFWRRDIWNKVGGSLDINFGFAMDWDLILRFQKAGAKIVHLPKFLGCFRVHPQQKTSNMLETGGLREMSILRKRELGFIPSDQEIMNSIKWYLLRHRLLNKWNKLN